MINQFEISRPLSIVVTAEKARHATNTEVGIAPRKIQQRAKSSSISVSDTGEYSK
ncbi:MAG: hypothetical protein WA631_18750 [Nitrososphaeraceae archaeon]